MQRICAEWFCSIGEQIPGQRTTSGLSRLRSVWVSSGLLFLMLVALSVACHYLGFSASVVYDGAYFINSKEPIFAQHNVLNVVSIVPVRPLFLLTFYFNYVLTGMDPFYFRFFNAILVAGSGLALAILAVLIFEIPALNLPGSVPFKRGVAMLMGVLFTVHPLQSLVVLYAWQREAIMGCLFYYSALAAYVAVRSGRISNTAGYVTTAILFLCGMLSKENVVTLPVSAMLAELTLFQKGGRDLVKRGAVACAVFGPPFLAYLLLTRLLHTDQSELVKGIIPRLLDHYKQVELGPVEVALTQARIFFSYLWMMVLPFVGNVEFMRAEVVSRSMLQPPVTMAAASGMLAIAGGAVSQLRRRPLLSFGTLFAIVSLLPESLLIPQYLFFGYRAILPMAGLLLILGYGLLIAGEWSGARLSSGAFRKAAIAVTIVPAIALGAVTATRAKDWTHVTFWTDLVERLPAYSRNVEAVPYLDIAVNCMSTLVYDEKYPEALALFDKTLAGANRPRTSQGESGDIRGSMDTFVETFGDQKMRAGGAMIALGAALQLTDRIDEAMLAYTKALEIEPYHVDAHLTLGSFLEASGKVDEAIGHYKKAVELNPGDALAHNCLGNALKRTGEVREAMEELARAIYVDPNSVMAYNNLALALQELGYYREAMDEYRKALAVDPRSAETYHGLGRAFAESGNPGEAIKNYRKALELKSGYAAAHCDLGLVLEFSGDPEGAADEYRKATEAEPSSPMSYLLLGRSLMILQQLPEALNALGMAVQLSSDFPSAHHLLGVALLRSGDIAGATKHLDKALELDPRLAAACTDLGLALTKARRLPEALNAFRRSLSLDASQPLAYLYMGNALEATGDHALAEQNYQTSVNLEPRSAEAWYCLATCRLRQGKAVEAAQAYDTVLRLRPDFPDAVANRAVALLQTGKIPEAISGLAKALALNPDSTHVLYALGLAFARMNENREAAVYFEQILKRDPHNKEAREYLDRMRRMESDSHSP